MAGLILDNCGPCWPTKKCLPCCIIGRRNIYQQRPKVVEPLPAQNLAQIRIKLERPLYSAISQIYANPTISRRFLRTSNDGSTIYDAWKITISALKPYQQLF